MLSKGIFFHFAIYIEKVSQSEITSSGLKVSIFLLVSSSVSSVVGFTLLAFLRSVELVAMVLFLKMSSNPSIVWTFL